MWVVIRPTQQAGTFQEFQGAMGELHEGTHDSWTAKRDLLVNQLQNWTKKEGETYKPNSWKIQANSQ